MCEYSKEEIALLENNCSLDWPVADLENWDKNYRRSKDLQKVINDYIRTEREKALYLQEFGRIPEEFDYPEWKQGIERSRYVKELTERNPTSSSKRPSRSKKGINPPKITEPWRPPAH